MALPGHVAAAEYLGVCACPPSSLPYRRALFMLSWGQTLLGEGRTRIYSPVGAPDGRGWERGAGDGIGGGTYYLMPRTRPSSLCCLTPQHRPELCCNEETDTLCVHGTQEVENS